MRINGQTLLRLEQDCLVILSKHNLTIANIDTVRKMWDVFHAANGYWLYKLDMNDSHIETALKRIFKK